jgi:hypothetical protein
MDEGEEVIQEKSNARYVMFTTRNSHNAVFGFANSGK